jgi:hypothetical protein
MAMETKNSNKGWSVITVIHHFLKASMSVFIPHQRSPYHAEEPDWPEELLSVVASVDQEINEDEPGVSGDRWANLHFEIPTALGM